MRSRRNKPVVIGALIAVAVIVVAWLNWPEAARVDREAFDAAAATAEDMAGRQPAAPPEPETPPPTSRPLPLGR